MGEGNPTVRRIIDGARDCFDRLGIAKTSIVDIASAARYSRPVIYKHFADKDEIVDRVCLEEMQAIQSILNRRIAGDLPFPDRMTEAILQAVLIASERPFLKRFMEDREAWIRSQSADGAVHRWVTDRWKGYIQVMQAQGILADDLDVEQTVSWISMIQSVLLLRFASEEMDETQLRYFVRRFVVKPLLG